MVSYGTRTCTLHFCVIYRKSNATVTFGFVIALNMLKGQNQGHSDFIGLSCQGAELGNTMYVTVNTNPLIRSPIQRVQICHSI